MIDNLELVIIQVYMPFLDSKNINESKSNFELSLSIIISIVKELIPH